MYNNEELDNEAMDIEMAVEEIVLPKVGVTYKIGINDYVGPNNYYSTMSRLCVDENVNEGWVGNSNPAIKNYHGWRGTNCDWAFYGCGVRKCINVKITGNRSKKILVVFGKDKVENQD
jgi:hypothetical protein